MAKVKRSIRTKVRCTDDELFELHKIADEQGLYISAVLRDSTLDKSYNHIVEVTKTDMYMFASAVNTFDRTINEIDKLVRQEIRVGLPYQDLKVDLRKVKIDIDSLYSELIKIVSDKRTRVKKSVVNALQSMTSDAIYDYNDGYDTRAHGISVSVSEPEIRRIRELADMEGCSISCLLKTNAFELYKYGTIDVMTDSLMNLVNKYEREQKFLNAILHFAKDNGIEETDIDRVLNIANKLKDITIDKINSIKDDPAAIREEAKEIVKDKTK